MSALWIGGAVVVLMALLSVLPVLRKMFWGFVMSTGVLLYFYGQHHPGEAMAAYTGLGGYLLARRPLLRVLGL